MIIKKIIIYVEFFVMLNFLLIIEYYDKEISDKILIIVNNKE